MSALLEFRDVYASYGGALVLDGISFKVEPSVARRSG